MKTNVALGLIALAAIGLIIGFGSMSSKGADEASVPIFLTEIPQGYRDWKLIAVSRLTAPKGSQLRGMLGNDIAIKAFQESKLPLSLQY
jgi:hypothetical protein